MDPLSDVLRAVRLTGAYFYLVEASPPWSVMTAPARELAPRILPDSQHLISRRSSASRPCSACSSGGSSSRPTSLAGTTMKIAAIAADVGYESEAAFSRAFKRVMGKSPAEFRQDRQD
jgi:AraC-like DNA-binding protein